MVIQTGVALAAVVELEVASESSAAIHATAKWSTAQLKKTQAEQTARAKAAAEAQAKAKANRMR